MRYVEAVNPDGSIVISETNAFSNQNPRKQELANTVSELVVRGWNADTAPLPSDAGAYPDDNQLYLLHQAPDRPLPPRASKRRT
jgi:hypothetical protein